MFIISCLTSSIICFTHWERNRHLRDSVFGQVPWKCVTKHGEKIQGKVLLKEGLNPELSFTFLWPPGSLGADRGWQTLHLHFGTSKAYAAHLQLMAFIRERHLGFKCRVWWEGIWDISRNHNKQHGTQICEMGFHCLCCWRNDLLNLYVKEYTTRKPAVWGKRLFPPWKNEISLNIWMQ